jgi:glucose-6-phosphate 1-dehydrogenase
LIPICRNGLSGTCSISLADPGTYQQLKDLLLKVDKDHATHGNYFYYPATAPDFFGPIVQQLSARAS